MEVLSLEEPYKYLGVGISAAMQTGVEFAFAWDNLQKKVAKWQPLHLPMTAKIHMIAVEVLPTLYHTMTVAKLPVDICKNINNDITRIMKSADNTRWRGIAKSKLEMKRGCGGAALPNVQRRAASLHGKH